MTVRDLITRAMFDLGVLQEGEVPTPAQATDGFNAANDWIDSLTPNFLTIYAVTRSTWTLTSASSYTVGTGGDVNIARPDSPQAIQNIGYVNNSLQPPFEVQQGPCLTEDQYAAIPLKTLSSPLPQAWYYSATFPLGTLKPYPIPSQSGLLGVVYTQTAIPEFTSLAQVISLPPGYRRYFRTHLALELAPVFTAEVSPSLARMAAESEAAIKTANVRPTDLVPDAAWIFGTNRFYNIFTDW